MNELFHFLASTAGRITRIVAGLVLVLIGQFVLSGAAGILLTLIGLVPVAAGLFDFCVFAPLFGKPFSGPKLRASH